jgi:hypothetical protein
MGEASAPDATRRTRRTRGLRRGLRRGPTIAGVLLVVVSLSVLRSPADVLTRLTSEGTSEGRIGDEGVRVPTPSGGTGTDGNRGPRPPGDAPRPTPDGGGSGRPVLDALLLREVRGGWRVEPGVEEAAALALIVGHGWQPDGVTGEDGMGEADPRRVVVLEAVEQPGQGAAVITLLIAPRGVSAGAPVHRVAFPILIDVDGASLGGAPWELPPPAHERRPLDGVPVADPELVASARRALDAVGHDGGSLRSLDATAGWPFIARTSTGAQLWLRWHVDGLVVTGLPLQSAAVGAAGTRPGWGEQSWEH